MDDFDRGVGLKRRHPSERNAHRRNMYGQQMWETSFEGIELGHDDQLIENVTKRLHSDAKGPWNGYLDILKRRHEILYPEQHVHPQLHELKELLEDLKVDGAAQHQILRWVNPRLQKNLSNALAPPKTLICSQCKKKKPATAKFWLIIKTGLTSGQIEQPCYWCRSKFWNRGAR